MNYKFMAEALEHAKSALWDGKTIDGKTIFVCHALVNSGFCDRGSKERAAVDAVIRWIEISLGRHETVTQWAQDKCRLLTTESQAYRFAWIDQMISILRS